MSYNVGAWCLCNPSVASSPPSRLTTPVCCNNTATSGLHVANGRFQHPELVRRWIHAKPSSLPQSLSISKVMVASYNTLGDNNVSCHHDLYAHIPPHFMNWDWRKNLICQDLEDWKADIVCLQEVDQYDDLMSSLEKEGFTGYFKFLLLEGESIEFRKFGLRDNVAQLLVFEMHEDVSRRLVVGNIHVLFNPNRGDIKLGQIRLFLQKAHELSEKWGNIPVVLAGDFNSTPQSAIYKFLLSSKLNITLQNKRQLSGQNPFQAAKFFDMHESTHKLFRFRDRYVRCSWTDEELLTACGNSNLTMLRHPLKLHSSYATLKGNSRARDIRGEPLVTTCHSKFLGAVDYLWYSDGLAPTKVLDTLPLSILRKTGGLPNEIFGSDHLGLVAEFAFLQKTKVGEEQVSSSTATLRRNKEE